MTINLFLIPDMNKLKETIRNTKGEVYLKVDDQHYMEMRSNEKVWAVLADKSSRGENMTIEMFNPFDFIDFCNYMSGTRFTAAPFC